MMDNPPNNIITKNIAMANPIIAMNPKNPERTTAPRVFLLAVEENTVMDATHNVQKSKVK